MFSQSLTRAVTAIVTALLFTASFVAAQDHDSALRITRTSSPQEKPYIRNSDLLQIDRHAAFNRLHQETALATHQKNITRERASGLRASALATVHAAASPPAFVTLGVGGVDINEVEPNNQVAQAVSLPVNVFGRMNVDGDVDFFAFQALAGQQITIEPFAARLLDSELIADLALFDSAGTLLSAATGTINSDPLIRFVPSSDQVLIIGISDLDDLGGARFEYLLNITRGNDLDEQEPNNSNAQSVPDLPLTIFGEITGRADVDFYSFSATAGQTLIVDVDAEVLGSRLDAEINLINPTTGTELFYNDQHDGDDPRYNIVLPYTGSYVIGVGSFLGQSRGFYRLNASLVSSLGAPIVSGVTRLEKKLMEIAGSGFTADSIVEVNGVERPTTFIDSNTLRAKAKSHVGNVVTVTNPPDERRSNPFVTQ